MFSGNSLVCVVGIEQEDPVFFSARLLNHIVGAGGFESRLTTEVRVKRGLTYGVYSFLVQQDHAATYQGQVASANDRIAEAVSVIRDEWQRAASEGVSQEELDAAKLLGIALRAARPLFCKECQQ